ncbi:uncharacterized protein LOC132729065 [Ruditapes philippinarum]|uniref:uncharacterized protein LOC132729065 n=1 Tax=Ruditapes philippinarum TaxID=129788 RepID=UPI00295ACC5C|nr:uncharacterized protein LOC132729065 [Ruditapes philippinarum]
MLQFRKLIGPLVPAFGLLVGVILHHRFPSQFKFIQQIISIQMFRSGCNHKMFRWFHKFGLCMSVNTTRQLVDRLGQDYDNKVKEWKQNIEENVLHVLPSPVPDTRNEESGWSSLSESEVEPSDTDEDQDEEQAIEDLSMVMEDTILYSESDDEQDFVPFPDIFEKNEILGYSLCWDNVQKMSVARHQSRHSGNKMLLWANCFATLDRVNLTSLPCNWEETVTAGSIDLKNFLPSDDDWKQLQTRMEVIVQRILTNVLDLDLPVEQHISHKFSNESAGKSQVVNLGVIKENPSTCKGVIEIMKNLHRYTPKDEYGKPWPVICH